MINTALHILALFFGMLTAFATVVLFSVLPTRLDSWFIFWILPIGGILFGVPSTIGVYYAMKWFHIKTSGKTVLLITAISLLAYLSLNYLRFWSLSEDHPGGSLTFIQYLYWDAVESSHSIRFGRRGQFKFDIGSLGWLGVLTTALTWGAVWLSSLWPALLLFRHPYCDRCRRYMKSDSRTERFFTSEEDAVNYKTRLEQSKSTRSEVTGKDEWLSANNGAAEYSPGHDFKIAVSHYRCKCGEQGLTATKFRLKDGSWS